jgi:hypothetical protein
MRGTRGTQKPGFFSGYQSYLFFANKKPGFLIPTSQPETTQKPGFFSGYQSYLFFANKKPGFSTPTSQPETTQKPGFFGEYVGAGFKPARTVASKPETRFLCPHSKLRNNPETGFLW